MAETAPCERMASETTAGDNTAPELMDVITTLVENGEFKEVEYLLKDGERDKELSDLTWDLVPLLCTFLTESKQNDKPDTIKSCEIVLDYLCAVSKPKELILVLLEQASAFCDDVKFKVLLAPIQKSLLSLKVKRSHSVAMALDTLYAHIQMLPLPGAEAQDLEGRDRVMFHEDPAVRKIVDVAAALIDFMVPFVKLATDGSENYEEHEKERQDLTHMLIKMLNQPLVHLDLSFVTEEQPRRPNMHMHNGPKLRPKSEARVIVEKLAHLLELLQPDCLRFVEMAEQRNARREVQLKEIQSNMEEDTEGVAYPDDHGIPEEIPPSGLACAVYLTLGEQLGMKRFPCVHTAQFMLECALPFVCAFLEKPVTFQVEKGLKLLTTTATALTNSSLCADMMGLESLVTAIKYLIKVVVHCPSKQARQCALKIFPLILSKFDDEGRYRYLQFVLMKAEHPGLEGYALNLLKDEVDGALKQETPCPYFVGLNLGKLLNHVFVLSEGATSDLLEESDRVLGALNLLRYLILRDNPKNNITGIWNLVEAIDKNYCAPLRTGVNMSRAHYQLEMDKTKAGEYQPKRGEPEMAVTIGNDQMPNLNKDQQLHVLQRALFTFDMIDSVLARVGEIIDHQKKQQQLSVQNENACYAYSQDGLEKLK